MKKLLLFIFSISLSQQIYATHLLNLYVYTETEYIQGPWSGSILLDELGDYRFLQAVAFDDYFGTVRLEIVEALIDKLRELKPENYTWDGTFELSGNTVIIHPEIGFIESETIINELTATYTNNGFNSVRIDFNGKSRVFTKNDISIPYLGLIVPKEIGIEEISTNADSLTTTEPALVKNKEGGRSEFTFKTLFYASVILNILLAGFLLLRKKK